MIVQTSRGLHRSAQESLRARDVEVGFVDGRHLDLRREVVQDVEYLARHLAVENGIADLTPNLRAG